MSYLQRGLNAEPAMVLSAIFGLGALVLPVVVPVVRRAGGSDTFQYDGGDDHPVRCPPNLCACSSSLPCSEVVLCNCPP